MCVCFFLTKISRLRYSNASTPENDACCRLLRGARLASLPFKRGPRPTESLPRALSEWEQKKGLTNVSIDSQHHCPYIYQSSTPIFQCQSAIPTPTSISMAPMNLNIDIMTDANRNLDIKVTTHQSRCQHQAPPSIATLSAFATAPV